MYPKSLTYQSAVTPRKPPTQEVMWKYLVLSLYLAYVRVFPEHLADSWTQHTPFPYMPDKWNLLLINGVN
jgi:hypothetical protein